MDFRDSDYDMISFLERLQDPNPGERNAFMETLPRLKEAEFSSPEMKDERCPVCLETFLAKIAIEEMAEAMDTPALSPYEQGVTKLPSCGHKFCRKDLAKWIISGHKDTCPLCRTPIGLPTRDDTSASTTTPPSGGGLAGSPFSEEAVRAFLNDTGSEDPNRHDPILAGMPQHEAEMLRQLRSAMRGVAGVSGPREGNIGDSPYQHDSTYQYDEADRSEFSGMYS